MLPLLFMLPLSSIFESSLQLMADLKAGVVPATRQAVINTVVTGAPNVDDIEDTCTTQQMREVPMHEYDPDRLAASERILGHRCVLGDRCCDVRLTVCRCPLVVDASRGWLRVVQPEHVVSCKDAAGIVLVALD